MPYADIDAGRLYYEVHGEGETLLCIQGLAMDVSGWRAQIPAFARRHRVVVFDNRDVGRSFYASAPYSVAAMAGDTLALADALGLERFHLLGSSLGGAIAQEVALGAPERVRTLTLAVSYGGYGPRSRARLDVALAGVAEQTDEQRAHTLLALTLSPHSLRELGDQLPAMVQMLLAYPHRQRRDGFLRQLQAGAGHDARPRLGALRLPVHVIGAELDAFVPVFKAVELAEAIPGARLSVIEGAAHAANLEASARYNELVLDFVAQAGLQAPLARADGA